MINLSNLEALARRADAMAVYDPDLDLEFSLAANPETILALIEVAKAAVALSEEDAEEFETVKVCEQTNWCPVCDLHPTDGHAEDCPLRDLDSDD